MSNGQRRLAAIMFTDIVGYSAISQRDEDRAVRLLDRHHQIINPILDAHQGRLVKTMGDGLMVEFSSAVEATRCAVEIQRSINQDNKTHDHDDQINLRIGIHLGDVVERDGDLIGDGVNIASRIEPIADAGGICITKQVLDQVQNKISLPHVSLGSPELKNIDTQVEVVKLVMPWQPQHVPVAADEKPWLPVPIQILIKKPSFRWGSLAVVAAAAATIVWLGGWFPTDNGFTATASPPAIAVLPFENRSNDPENQYFSDGISEEILSRLARVEGLRVAARSSSFVFRERTQPLKDIAEQLNVNTILEGTVQRDGDQVRVSVALINAQDGFQMWANTYDYQIEDVFALQTEISSRIAEALELKLTASTENQGPPTENLDAYNAYLKGRFFWNQRTKEGLEKARALFQEAIDLDPAYAQAHAGLADTYSLLINYGHASHNETFLKAKEAALKAVDLNSNLAEAQAALAYVKENFDLDIEGARTHYLRAIELNPSYATARHWYSIMLEEQGEADESLREAEIAADLDPLSPIINVNLASKYVNRENFEKAEEALQKAIEIDPGFVNARLFMAQIKGQQKDFAGAEEQFEFIKTLHPNDIRVYTGMASLRLQQWDWDSAEQWFLDALSLDQPASTESGVRFNYFIFLWSLGRIDEAIENLNLAHQLDPSPQSSFSEIWTPYISHYYAGDFEGTIDSMQALIDAGKHQAWAELYKASTYLTMHQVDDALQAIQQAEKAFESEQDVILRNVFEESLGWIKTTYHAVTGDIETAEAMIEASSQRPNFSTRWEGNAAAIYLLIGEMDKAWELIEVLYDEGEAIDIGLMRTNPIIHDIIKDDPRYHDLMQRINLEP